LAITHYKTIRKHLAGLSLVHCKLETGRTHQIRVHLSERECPIIGDVIYATPHRVKSLKSVSLRERLTQNPRLLLHAAELGFVHPVTKKKMMFRSSWPKETEKLLAELELL
jgi:23S rRNA pseudouridine1911/1915/1917 synthase